MFEAIIIYLMLGAVAGVAAGLLGIGGGLVIVPMLALVFQAHGFDDAIVMQLALGTSLATIVFTAISSVLAHHRHGAVQWPLVFILAPGMLLGSFVGAFVADQMGGDQLKRLFALFEFAIGIYMIAGAPQMQQGIQVMMRRLELMAVGGGIGLLSALLGIGGGTMTVPYLSWRGLDMRRAVAVSSACGMPIALSGALGYLLAGLDAEGLPQLASGYIYWPALVGIVTASLLAAPVGAGIAHRLPVSGLKKIFGLLLLVMAAMILYL